MTLNSYPNMSKHIFFILLICAFSSCSDELKIKPLEEIPNEPISDQVINDLDNPITEIETDLGKAEFFNESLVDDNYILANDAGANRVYLMNKKAEIVYEWNFQGKNLGNDAFLLPNGKLLTMIESEDPKINFGGQAGIVQMVNKNGSADWSFQYSTENHISHHDAELLPNGNVLFQSWERKTLDEAKEAGSNMQIDVFPEAIIEVNPLNDEIVWEWHAWDHLIQNHNDTKANFGVIADHPHLINLNYVADEKGDIMHANGLTYDSKNDLIYLSVNFFSEVWVIDHSTSSQEAASNTGGTYNKGGDLIYRFGNPEAYGNDVGTRLFDHNHYPNLLSGADKGNILIFSNGFTEEQSTAYELELPNPLRLEPNMDNEPVVKWSFTHETLFSPKVSGVEKLSNGNRLITEGDAGFWEVTEKGKVVWRFKGAGFFWRGYNYKKDAAGITLLGL